MLSEPATRIGLGQAYLFMGRLDEAKKMIDGAAFARKAPAGQLIKGEVHRLASRLMAARKEYKNAAKTARKSVDREGIKGMRAYALAQVGGKDAEAMTLAEEALTVNQRDVLAHEAIAVCRLRNGDLAGAEDKLAEIAAICPAEAIRELDDAQFEAISRSTRMSDLMRTARMEQDRILDDVWARHPGLRESLYDTVVVRATA